MLNIIKNKQLMLVATLALFNLNMHSAETKKTETMHKDLDEIPYHIEPNGFFLRNNLSKEMKIFLSISLLKDGSSWEVEQQIYHKEIDATHNEKIAFLNDKKQPLLNIQKLQVEKDPNSSMPLIFLELSKKDKLDPDTQEIDLENTVSKLRARRFSSNSSKTTTSDYVKTLPDKEILIKYIKRGIALDRELVPFYKTSRFDHPIPNLKLFLKDLEFNDLRGVSFESIPKNDGPFAVTLEYAEPNQQPLQKKSSTRTEAPPVTFSKKTDTSSEKLSWWARFKATVGWGDPTKTSPTAPKTAKTEPSFWRKAIKKTFDWLPLIIPFATINLIVEQQKKEKK